MMLNTAYDLEHIKLWVFSYVEKNVLLKNNEKKSPAPKYYFSSFILFSWD